MRVKINRGKRSDCDLHLGLLTASCHVKREVCVEEEEIRFPTENISKLLLKFIFVVICFFAAQFIYIQKRKYG